MILSGALAIIGVFSSERECYYFLPFLFSSPSFFSALSFYFVVLTFFFFSSCSCSSFTSCSSSSSSSSSFAICFLLLFPLRRPHVLFLLLLIQLLIQNFEITFLIRPVGSKSKQPRYFLFCSVNVIMSFLFHYFAQRVMYLRELRLAQMERMMAEFISGVNIYLGVVRDAKDYKVNDKRHLVSITFFSVKQMRK